MSLQLGLLGAKSLLSLVFFWGTEALFVLFSWQNRAAPQTNFIAAVMLLLFWTVVSVAMTLRVYKNVIDLKQATQVK